MEDERVGLLLVEQQVDTVDPERHPVHGGCRRTAQLHGGGDDGRFWAGNGSGGQEKADTHRVPRGARVRGAVRRARACDEQAREDRRDHEAVESPALLRQAQIRSPHAGSCSRFRGRPAAGPEHLAISRGRRAALLRFLDRPGALHGMVMGSSRPVRRQPLLPGRWQPAAIAVTAVSVIGFTTMATAYRFQERAGRLDTLIAKPLIGNAAFDWGFLRDITTLGAPWTVAMMSGLLMLVAAGVGSGWRQVVLAGMGPAAATLLAEFALKPLVDRRFRGDLAFPSGHATGVAAVAATAVVIVVAGRVGGRLTRAAMSLVAAVVVAAVEYIARRARRALRHRRDRGRAGRSRNRERTRAGARPMRGHTRPRGSSCRSPRGQCPAQLTVKGLPRVSSCRKKWYSSALISVMRWHMIDDHKLQRGDSYELPHAATTV